MVPKLQLRVPDVIEHEPAPVPPLMDQLSPALFGRVSESMTLFADPAPPLFTVIVNPMLSVELTVAASAVLVTVRSGQLTVITTGPEELFEVLASLVAETLAVFVTGPQFAEVVGDEICTVTLPGARVPMLQVKVPAVIEQLPPAVPPSTVQLKPPGRRSLSTTPLAVPGPALLTVIR